jgi:hypothetical protein
VTSVRAATAAVIQRHAAPTAPRRPNATAAARARKRRVPTRRLVPMQRLARSKRPAPIRRSAQTSLRVTNNSHAAASPIPGIRARAASAPVMSGVNAAVAAGDGANEAGAMEERIQPTAAAAARDLGQALGQETPPLRAKAIPATARLPPSRPRASGRQPRWPRKQLHRPESLSRRPALPRRRRPAPAPAPAPAPIASMSCGLPLRPMPHAPARRTARPLRSLSDKGQTGSGRSGLAR